MYNTCQKSYVGQTNNNLKSRFQKHIRYIKSNNPHSSYALHILNSRHEYGSINDTMTLIKQVNNPSLLLPWEQMYTNVHNSTIIMNSFLNNTWMSKILCLNSYIINTACHNPYDIWSIILPNTTSSDLHTRWPLTQVNTYFQWQPCCIFCRPNNYTI
jgi:hypothetical protein